MTKALRAIGLMSGTSMDGVDVALIETDGETIADFGPTGGRAYTPDERAAIAAALAAAPGMTDRTDRGGAIGAAEAIVTAAHGDAVETFLAANGIAAGTVDLVGFHGQTILHRPGRRLTVQIGDGAALARRLGIDVVHDLRAADVAAGGQGAPLVPVYHRALAVRTGIDLPAAVLNLGGVGNVTWIGDADPLAFDTGPGNALVDDWVAHTSGVPFDAEGRIAASGTVDTGALDALLANPYFLAPPPKSLDRNDFALGPVAGLSPADGAATLTAFTAASVALAVPWLPQPPRRWIVVGGGARNPTLMRMLGERLDAPVTTGAALGWSGDHVEAQAFAFLAVRALRGLPLTFPSTTGVPRPLTSGLLAKAGPTRGG